MYKIYIYSSWTDVSSSLANVAAYKMSSNCGIDLYWESWLWSLLSSIQEEERRPGDRWMIRGPKEYVPPVEVEVVMKRQAIPLDENEGIYVRDIKTGKVTIRLVLIIRKWGHLGQGNQNQKGNKSLTVSKTGKVTIVYCW